MPVQAVAVQVEGDGIDHVVDGRHHLLSVLPSRTVLDGQAAADEVVLNVHDDKG